MLLISPLVHSIRRRVDWRGVWRQKGARRTVDASARRADEGRGRTAKSHGELSTKRSRGYPNGATRPSDEGGHPGTKATSPREVRGGTETSQYPEEAKSSERASVVANEGA